MPCGRRSSALPQGQVLRVDGQAALPQCPAWLPASPAVYQVPDTNTQAATECDPNAVRGAHLAFQCLPLLDHARLRQAGVCILGRTELW